MCLAFIHIGRYVIKAKRHLACVQNGITQLGDWRMETWPLALTGLSCLHPPISLVVKCHSEHMPMPSRYKRHWTYKMPVGYNLSSVWVRLSIFSQLPIIQYVRLCVFSLPISFVMIERIYILCHIFIIKSEARTITHCSWNNGMRCMSFYILIFAITIRQTICIIVKRNHVTRTIIYSSELQRCWNESKLMFFLPGWTFSASS